MIASTRTDINLRSFYEEHGLNLDGLDLSEHDEGEFSTLLKISHSSHIAGVSLDIQQGNENAVDVDVCEDIAIAGEFGTAGAVCDQVVTVKGGCQRIRIAGVIRTLETRRKAHVQVGNWMDQSYRLTRDVLLDFKRSDGGPVYVAIGWAVPFTVQLRGDCRLLVWESVKLKAYVLAKFAIRAVLRIPKGTKGPDWF